MFRRATALGALAIVTFAGEASAAPSARLVYVRDTGAEDCPDEPALRAAVAARLGYDPFFPHAAATLFAEVTREGGTYRARVKLVDEGSVVRGARDLEHKGPRCADLVDAMALTMSIAIDPRSLTSPPAPSVVEEPPRQDDPPPAEGPPAPPPAAVDAPPPRAAAPEIASRVGLFATLAASGWFGAAPAPATGLTAGVGLRRDWLAVLVEGRFDLPSSREVAAGTVETSLVAGSIAPCFVRGVVFGCAVATLGSLSARARGITFPSSDDALHFLLGGRAGVAIPLSGAVEIRAHGDLLYAATPQILRIDGRDVYTLPRLGAGISAGFGVHFF
ncbi:MAG: hypothetical protein KF819_25930 [Labilithrix sp.]|nr:hypothetical protein [Labilithrix sp.]